MLKLEKTIAAVVLGLGCVGFAQGSLGELSLDNPVINHSGGEILQIHSDALNRLDFTVDPSLMDIANSGLHIEVLGGFTSIRIDVRFKYQEDVWWSPIRYQEVFSSGYVTGYNNQGHSNTCGSGGYVYICEENPPGWFPQFIPLEPGFAVDIPFAQFTQSLANLPRTHFINRISLRIRIIEKAR